MEMTICINAQKIKDLTRFMSKVETRLKIKQRYAGDQADVMELMLDGKMAEMSPDSNSFLINQIIMENSITVQTLAAQVRTVRNNQNKYFRIPKENKEERQAVLRASKASEANLDKMVAIVLDQDPDINR